MPEANIVWFAELFTHMLVFYCVRDTLATTTSTTQSATAPGTGNTDSVRITASSSYLKPIVQSSTTQPPPPTSVAPHNSDPSPIKSVEYNRDSARTRQMLEARMRPTSSTATTTTPTNTLISSSSSIINAFYSQPPPQPPNRFIPFTPTTTATSAAASQPVHSVPMQASKVYTYTQPPSPPPLPITPQVNYTTTQPMQLNRKSTTPSSTPNPYTQPSHTSTPHTSHTSYTPPTSSSSDPFYLPSLAFPGIHQFFYRYILLLHTHTTFTMHLKDALLSSIDTLCDISWEHIDMIDLYNTTSTPYTSHTTCNSSNTNMSHSGSGGNSMQRERISYTHHILKLKLLGRFLGVVEFSHRWNCSSSNSSSSTHIQPTDTHTTNTYSTHTNNTTNNHSNNSSNKNKMKRSTGIACLPLKQYLFYAYKTSNLCLYIPWIIEFIRMSEWDSSNGCLYAYIEVLGMLKGVQGSVRFRLPLEGSRTGTGTGVGHGAAMMSSNRYVHFHTVCYVMLLIYMRICHNYMHYFRPTFFRPTLFYLFVLPYVL